MMLGLSLANFTILHTAISLVAIATGVVVLYGWLQGRAHAGMTAVFLVTTVLTSVTGFMFPFNQLLPSHITGIISLAVLAPALFALYVRRAEGGWRNVYLIAATVALYLNCFVLVVQIFQKISFVRPLAPTQSEPPFLVAQVAVLIAFVVLGWFAVKRYKPAMA
jgi:hypothetical protein